jgi:hydroxymethylbilane synthase
VDLRGNVPTRLRKLLTGEHHDAILLAEAGLVRLGYLPPFPPVEGPEPVLDMPGLFATRLDPGVLPRRRPGSHRPGNPRADDRSRVFAESIGHQETWLRVTAEREFLRLLDAGCHTPSASFPP